jgi:Na+-translocating ferredoxin:NAD+ oxidoreductase RnfE subunit
VLTRGVWRENPVIVNLMGLSPALAVTNSVQNGMALASGFALMGSSVFVSALRRAIPHEVRISTYVLIVGTFALGAGAGLTLALVLMTSIREQVDLSDVPRVARGTALISLIAGFLSLAFMGFPGIGSGA